LLWVMKVCGMTTENIFESKNNNTQWNIFEFNFQ
jgi:hypothetical protein